MSTPEISEHKLPTGNPFSTLAPVLAPETLEIIAKEFGFTHLTAVQSATIPAFLSNKDVCVQAVTGSGKTLAFVVPMIEILTTLPNPLAPHHIGALIITPTRELAQQIHSIVAKFTAAVPHFSNPNLFITPPALCIGGKNPELELQSMKKSGVNIMIGTPGRLDQVLSTRFVFDPSKLEILILDEADRLMEQGFSQNLTSIIKRLPKQRRTGLFSATLTAQIQELARMGLRNPVNITLKVHHKERKPGTVGLETAPGEESIDPSRYDPNNPYLAMDKEQEKELLHAARIERENDEAMTQHQAIPTSLTNYYQVVQPEHKMLHLVNFLMQHSDKNIIVFFLTCAEVDFFYRVVSTFPPLQALYSPFNHEMLETVGLQHIATSQPHFNKSEKSIPKAMFCALHGQMNQSKRTRTLEAYKTHTTQYNSQTYPDSSLSSLCTTVPTASNTRVKPAAQNATNNNNNNNNPTNSKSIGPQQSTQSSSPSNEPQSGQPKRRLGSVLFCTDVASRGVDVNHVDWVLQIDPPQQPDTFIHRIGRCARAGQRGMALTWLLKSEESFVELMKNKHVPFQDFSPLQIALNQQLMQKLPQPKAQVSDEPMAVSGKGDKKAKKVKNVVLEQKALDFDMKDVENAWDIACWSPCEEDYFSKSDSTSETSEEPSTTTISSTTASTKKGEKTEKNSKKTDENKLVHLDAPNSTKETLLTNIEPLPDQISFKKIVPYNTYKVLVEKKRRSPKFQGRNKKIKSTRTPCSS